MSKNSNKTFEELSRIAKKEFDCTLVQTNEKMSFKDLFGFGLENISEGKTQPDIEVKTKECEKNV